MLSESRKQPSIFDRSINRLAHNYAHHETLVNCVNCFSYYSFAFRTQNQTHKRSISRVDTFSEQSFDNDAEKICCKVEIEQPDR